MNYQGTSKYKSSIALNQGGLWVLICIISGRSDLLAYFTEGTILPVRRISFFPHHKAIFITVFLKKVHL